LLNFRGEEEEGKKRREGQWWRGGGCKEMGRECKEVKGKSGPEDKELEATEDRGEQEQILFKTQPTKFVLWQILELDQIKPN
jgi:hypothetical protein